MYNPPAFSEDRLEQRHQLIRTHPLGLLISSGQDGPLASPLPFHLMSDGSPLGRLQGHLSRANPHWRTLDGQDVLVVFQGADGYVTPSWYQSKAEHGKVVPTWNYVMVQVRGVLQVIDDHEWLRAQITRLTHDHEAVRPEPWHVTDATASLRRRTNQRHHRSRNRDSTDRRQVEGQPEPAARRSDWCGSGF